VRMPRLVGVDNAVEWIATGATRKPDAALKDGVVGRGRGAGAAA